MAAASHSSPLIFANDIHAGALQLAQDSAEAAGVSSMIDFNLGDVATYRPAQSPGLVVTNPPWELRLDGASAAWTGLGAFCILNTFSCSFYSYGF